MRLLVFRQEILAELFVIDKPGVVRDNSAMSVTAIQTEMLNLPADERARLIDVLWDSLSATELKARESAWAEESERRIDAYDAGKLTARDAKAVFTDLKKPA